MAQLTGTAPVIELLKKILCQAIDSDTFAISDERPDDAFLSQTLVINQGQSMHDRVVAVVDRTADVMQAANKLVSARFTFGGASPYAPDIVMVHEAVLRSFLEEAVRVTGKSCIVNSKVAINGGSSPNLLRRAEKSPNAQIIVSGAGWGIVKIEDRFVLPKFEVSVSHMNIDSKMPRESELLQGKLNEKILLVQAFTSLDDAIEGSRKYGFRYSFPNTVLFFILIKFNPEMAHPLHHTYSQILSLPNT